MSGSGRGAKVWAQPFVLAVFYIVAEGGAVTSSWNLKKLGGTVYWCLTNLSHQGFECFSLTLAKYRGRMPKKLLFSRFE